MKIIKKNQNGGAVYISDFVPLTHNPLAGAVPQTASASTTTQKKEKEDLLDNDMILKLSEHALPSDLEAFVNRSGMFSDQLYDSRYDYSRTNTDIKSLLLYMNRMRWESSSYQESVKNITSIEGTSEVAITPNNGVFVIRDGGLAEVSINDLNDNENPLTNAQLADIRKNNPSAAFNTMMTETLANATSMKQIRDVISAALTNLQETKYDRDLFAGTPRADVNDVLSKMNFTLNDMQKLDANSLIKTKVSETSNAKQIIDAVNTIYSQLTPNMRVLMQLRADEIGVKDVRNLIIEYVSSRSKNDVSLSMDVVNAKTHKSKSSGEDDKDITDIKYTEGVHLLIDSDDSFTLNAGTVAEIRGFGATAPVTHSSSGSVKNNLNGSEILSSTFIAGVDTSNFTVAGQKIDSANLTYMMLSSPNVHAMDLPVDMTLLHNEGVIAPDFTLARQVQDIEKTIKANNITDPNEINKIYSDAGLPVKYIGTDKITNKPILNITNYRRFLAYNVYADAEAFPGDKVENSGLVSKIDDDGIVKLLEESIRETSKNKGFNASKTWWLGSDAVYKGVLYAPMKENALYYYLGAEHELTVEQAIELGNLNTGKQVLENSRESYTKPNTSDYFQ